MNEQKYEKHLNKGAKLYEEGEYNRAIEEYRLAIKYNDKDISARFDLARCYAKTGQIWRAKDLLTGMAPRIGGGLVSGAYYRLWAYVAGEEERYDVALACLKLAQRVNRTADGCKEERWLRARYPGKVGWEDVVPLMKSYGIPVIFAMQW